MPDTHPLPAGDFLEWLGQLRLALRDQGPTDVPCGSCTGCCTSSQFVHVEPDEVEALAAIPSALLFPAPRLPAGHLLLGYDERGHCPMLVDGACSIYEQRPRTCRTYDCRVLAATEVRLDDPTRSSIAERVDRWRFGHPTAADDRAHRAARAAAAYLDAHPEVLPPDAPRPGTAQRAVLALGSHEAFLPPTAETAGETGDAVWPDVATVEVAVARHLGSA